MTQANRLKLEFLERCTSYLLNDVHYSQLEKIPSDAESSDEDKQPQKDMESKGSEEDSTSETDKELDQTRTTLSDEDDGTPHSSDKDWNPSDASQGSLS